MEHLNFSQGLSFLKLTFTGEYMKNQKTGAFAQAINASFKQRSVTVSASAKTSRKIGQNQALALDPECHNNMS